MTRGQLPLALAPPSPETGGENPCRGFPDDVCGCGCGLLVPMQKRGGKPKRYFSDEHQRRHYSETHPRVAVKPAPADGEPYEGPRKWLLARLEEGPVSTLELRREPWPASQNPAQRVLELRNRQHDIRTERRGRRTWYQLWKDGEPVGRLP